MNNRVKVVICGKTYTIQTEETPSYVTRLAKDLDKRINAFLDANTSASVTAATVMVGLELMDEAARAIADGDHIRSQIKGYVEESTNARIEADQLQRELNLLKKENQNLKKELEKKSAGEVKA
ncbi:MAG: cell division protein ZapA [Candidatus Merdivicinus sp.]|jgi:cell division protein ZapA (FtsZ GTPase activity inhibitor)